MFDHVFECFIRYHLCRASSIHPLPNWEKYSVIEVNMRFYVCFFSCFVQFLFTDRFDFISIYYFVYCRFVKDIRLVVLENSYATGASFNYAFFFVFSFIP